MKTIQQQDKENIALQEELKNAPDSPSKAEPDPIHTKPVKTAPLPPLAPSASPSTPVNNEDLQLAKQLGYTPSQLSLVKRTVAKGATNDELAMFIHIAKKANLDPFLKEIWFIKYKGGETIMMTGRDGFLSIAQNSKEFEGLQSAAVYEGDEFKVDYTNPDDIKIKHITNPFQKEAGKIVGAWARVKRKNCIDTVEIVEFRHYAKTYAGRKSMWDMFP